MKISVRHAPGSHVAHDRIHPPVRCPYLLEQRPHALISQQLPDDNTDDRRNHVIVEDAS
jgi:hypothetical protein